MLVIRDLSPLKSALRSHLCIWCKTCAKTVTLLRFPGGKRLNSLDLQVSGCSLSIAWDLCQIDEQWNIDQWGEDADAAELAATRRADFLRAAELLRTLGHLS